MNFLLRSNNQTAAPGLQPIKENEVEESYASKTALDDLASEDLFPESMPSETRIAEIDEVGDENGSTPVSSEKNNYQVGSHTDVTEDEGFIIIPYNELPDDWTEATDILSFRSLDRSFVFPGEQIQLLACLSAYKQDTEIITPFKVAAVMNKNGIGKSSQNQNGDIGGETNLVSQTVGASSSDQGNQDGETVMKGKIDSHKDVSSGESLLRKEDHKRQTEQLLQRFKDSHFFARIAESNEPLWSRRRAQDGHPESSSEYAEQLIGDSLETATNAEKKNSISAAIDGGKFDAHKSGGLARATVKCCSLPNGDIVVLLQVTVGVQFVRDPILEILQFEKYQERKSILQNQNVRTLNQDPSGELLKWLLPVKNSTPPPARPLSPPKLSSSTSIKGTPPKPAVSGSSSSQLFSFGHFRSYSMSSLPPNPTPAPVVPTPNAKPTFDPEDWNQFSFDKFVENGRTGNKGLYSFRGVPLQQERFSVRCGLEGIFTPGRRWKRKIEFIQPVEIRSSSVECNTDDLLCVHVKNVSPAHAPDIVLFIDAITIIFEEVSKGGPSSFLPIASIESGSNHSLPNLPLRRGEEHSFILKPATSLWKHPKGHSGSYLQPSRGNAGNAASSRHLPNNTQGKHSGSPADQYAVLVSCRCNYTESKLFFKQPTSWRPRISKDLMISVASEMSRQTLGSDETQLPAQVLTLQASNMTSDNLTLTVLAPASFTSRSVVPLSDTPPQVPSVAERVNSDRQGTVMHGLNSVSLNQGQKVEDSPLSVSTTEKTVPLYDVVRNSDLGCTHLWLQSRVPLGCVPSQSTTTVKIEVLPLTDGIITLDSLKIEVKEKDRTYIPEQSLKINATSSIAAGIF